MKTIILILTIIMLNISCKKKKSVEPVPVIPVKTTKSFNAKITFNQDSIGTYYNNTIANPMYISMLITDIPVVDTTNTNGHVIYFGGNTTFPIGFVGSKTYYIQPYYTSYNPNDSFHYYITIRFSYQTYLGGTRGGLYCKQYTFVEGDNGTIDFKALP